MTYPSLRHLDSLWSSPRDRTQISKWVWIRNPVASVSAFRRNNLLEVLDRSAVWSLEMQNFNDICLILAGNHSRWHFSSRRLPEGERQPYWCSCNCLSLLLADDIWQIGLVLHCAELLEKDSDYLVLCQKSFEVLVWVSAESLLRSKHACSILWEYL